MQRSQKGWVVWTGIVLVLLYIPLVSVILASLANTRYLRFPHRIWTIRALSRGLGAGADLRSADDVAEDRGVRRGGLGLDRHSGLARLRAL